MKLLNAIDKNSHIVKTNYLITLFCFLFILVFFSICYILNLEFELSDFAWSLIFVGYVFFVYIFRYVNKVNLVEIYSLFFVTTLIFMGGRFFAILLGYNANPLFELDFFTYRLLNDKEKSLLMFLLFLGLSSLEVGYYASKLLFKPIEFKKSVKEINTNSLLIFMVFVVGVYVAYTTYTNINTVLKGGYLELFIDSQNSGYSYNFLNNVQTLMYALVGIICIQKNKNMQNLYLFILGGYFLGVIFTGSRGSFVCFILFLMWYFNDFGVKRVNALKVFTYFALIFLGLNTVYYMFTLRKMSSDVNDSLDFYQKILQFLYDQGVSLFVFNESLYLSNYPIHQYFQNFLPGSTFIASLLGGDIRPENKSFVTYLNSQLNPQLFEQGFGLGWAFFADAYRYSFDIIYLYCFFIISFSIFINWLQLNLYRNRLVMVIAATILIHVLFLPRGSLNTVFPLIFYTSILYFLVISFKNKRHV
ncbi:O-antigen polysaccharide polymerase Wzy [Acinetobacter wuhouensis]|uniref:O-antigen polysaccharide polymerase Wzy n=1 Tax=Acinetobacter wuhouensis TaxID=1879050 RepID=A0A3G2SYM6_9GAMM|nr:O-antigen polysaccharide polymerase Wzy [Acinetobacter wuhouensis]AYO52796.1 O-antigen polysaccharide polymerase Wzy [Acinetobacter wuhouensis]